MGSNLIGRTLLDQFRVDAFIASGGMGAVYRAWDLKRNVYLAMKVLHADLADDPAVFKRFQREARALQKLAHPNIVPFYGLYQTEELVFLLERFIDGPTLKHILRQRGGQPMPLQEVLVYFKALSAALGYAHANGVVHCDVKPGNVMVDQGGNIYLTDFGIARHAESTVTTLAVAGTPAYMAPEQIRGEAVSAQTDIYAVGVILFELVTGRRPFQGGEQSTGSPGGTVAERIRYEHLHVLPPDPRELNPALPEGLGAVILKAMAKEAGGRYASMQAMFAAVCAAAGVQPEHILDRVSVPGMPGSPQPRSPGALPVPGPQPPPTWKPVPTRQRGQPTLWLWPLLGGTAVLVLVLASTMRPNPSPPPSVAQNITLPPTFSSQETPVPTVTTRPTQTRTPTLTPSPISTPTPNVVFETKSLGRSVRGREILMTEIGYPNGAAIVVIGGIEGGEQADTTATVYDLIDWYRTHPEDIPQGTKLYLIPTINPDGSAEGSRYNANGVDINRNWQTSNWQRDAPESGYPQGKPGAGGPFPFSEPETAAVISSELARRMREILSKGVTSSYEQGPDWSTVGGYSPTGEAIGWPAEQGIPAVDIVSIRNQRPPATILSDALAVLVR